MLKKYRIVLAILSIGSFLNIVYFNSQQEAVAQQQSFLTEPCSTGLQKSAGFTPYQNPSFGITIQYPSTWTVNDTHLVSTNYIYGIYHEVAEISPRFANIRPSFSISFISLKPNATLDAYLANTIQSYKTYYPNFTLTSNPTNLYLACNPGYKITYSFDSKPDKVLGTEIGTIINGSNGMNLYQITYLTDAKQYYDLLPNIDKMIKSLTININAPINETNTMAAIKKHLTPQDIAGL
jgi:hypothetical protein